MSDVPHVLAGARWSGRQTRPRVLWGASATPPVWMQGLLCGGELGPAAVDVAAVSFRAVAAVLRERFAFCRAPAVFVSLVLPPDTRDTSSRDHWPQRDSPPRRQKPAEPARLHRGECASFTPTGFTEASVQASHRAAFTAPLTVP